MKHTRRPLSLLLALMMIVSLFSGLAVTASADQLPAITVESGEKTVDKDGKITVPVSISDNPGFTYAYLTVSYDDTALKLTAVYSDVVETDFNKNIIELEGNKGKSNFTGNGTIFTMTFEALKNGESSVSLAYKNGDSGNITNVAEEKVLVSFTPGTVKVKGLPGGETPTEPPAEPDYELRVLTFEDKDYKGDVNFAGAKNWSSLIDDPQYGGKLLYGEDGMGVFDVKDAYYWYDKGNTELYSVISGASGSWCYWSGGHAISNYASGDIANFGDYQSQLTVYKEGASGLVRTGAGHNGSDNFAVHFGYADTSGYGLTEEYLPRLTFKDGSTHVIDSMYVKLTDYLLNCIVDGNSLTPAMSEKDTLYLRAIGYDKDGKKLSETKMEVCKGTELLVKDWTKWDLSCLGEVSSVALEINGSCENGYGFSQPAYFAFDDVAVRFAKTTEPEHTHTLTRHEAVAPTCGTDGNSEYYSCECGKFFSDAEGTTEIEENSWILEKTNEHTDAKNNETGANGKDGLCDVCGTYCNHAPVLKSGVQNVSANVVLGEAYLLRDLQSGKIFEDPDGDVLSVAGGGAGNAESHTCFYYNRSADGGETWSGELDFASALFGATTISLTETVAGTYLYRFYAKDGYGGDSRNNESGDYWYLTLRADTAANLDFEIHFFIGKDQNYNNNGNKMPIIKLWKSDGNSNKVGSEIALTAVDAENGYARMNASVKGGWYVYEGFGWNTETNAYDIPLGGMQIKLPADSNVDGNAGGGTDIYLRVMSIYTTSKKLDGTYFGADDYTVRVVCPIMQCDAVMGAPYVSGNYSYYPTLFYAGGNSCLFNYYLYPTDTDNYMFSQSINGTLPTGTGVQNKNATVNSVVQLTVTVPENAKFGLYFQYNNFNTSEQPPNVAWKTNGDGTKTAAYKVSKGNSNYTWRMTDTNGVYVTKAGWLPSQSAAGTMTLSFDGASTEKYSHDFSKLGTTTITRDEADLQVFVDATGAKALGGATERIRAYRMWQLINSDTANIMIEPDYTWTKLSGDATISFVDDNVTVTGTQIDSGNGRHNWADINANGGTSIFAVRYDAIDLDSSNNKTHAGFYPATNPDRVAFVVVADELGTATADVQFNGDFTANSRLPGWDYIYDTWYYLDGEENPALTFTATDAVTVEYAFGTTNGSTMESTVSAFTAINAEDGVYSVPLAAMNNAVNNFGGTVIIRMTDAAGKYSYQLVKVARMTVTVTNKTFPGEPAMPGSSVELTFDGLYRSINKISGIFNPTTFYLRYTMNGAEIDGKLGQYQQMDKSGITLTIPGDIEFAEGEDRTTVTATNGYVFGSMYSAANPFSAMYYMTDVGVGTNFNAVTVSFAFQKLSDIPITVTKMPTVAVTLNVVGSDDAAVVVTNEDGTAQAAENGVYTLGFGTYKYSIEAEGFIKEVGKFSVSSADGEAKTVTVTLRAADAGTWDGSTRTAVTPNAEGIYEIRTGAELAWFAAQVNAGTGVAYNAKLLNDISLGYKNWTPIGSSTQKYAGTFDGNGHWITDLYCSGAGYQGLFGYGSACTIRNLGVHGEVNSTKAYAAGILAYSAGATTIEGCVNSANVNVSGIAATATGSVGGVVGSWGVAAGTVRNCYNTGDINGAGKSVGGVSGGGASTVSGKVINSYNIGYVSGNAASTTGSLTGNGTAANFNTSYYLNGTTNGSKALGTAKTADEMKSADFVSTLGDAFAPDVQNINQGYPILNWQIKPVEVAPTVEDGKASAVLPANTVVAENKPAELDVTASGETVTETELTVPAAAVAELAKAEKVTIKSNVGSISFDKTAFEGIASGAAESKVTISIKEAAAPDGAPGEAVGAKLIELTAKDAQGNNLFDGSGSGSGSATITIPYEAEVAEGNVPVVYYFNGRDYEKVDCTYDAANKTVTFTVSHFSGYLTTQEEAPKEYTIAAIADQTKRYTGETVMVSVKVSGNTFEGAEVVLTYNKDLFTYVSDVNTVSGATVAKVEDGKIKVQFSSIPTAADDTVLTKLSFTANEVAATTEGSFGFDSAKAGDTEWTYKDNWPAATKTPATVSVVKQFTVNFLDKDGNEISDSTQTVDQDAKVTDVPDAPAVDYYDFDKWYAGQTGYTADEIKDADVTADVTYIAGYTPKQYEVTLADGLNGNPKATYGSDYVVTISDYAPNSYNYTVKYTVGVGEEKTATDKQDGTFTIPGEELTDTVSVKVIKVIKGVTIKLFEDYVNGYTLILVSGNSATGFKFDGNAMYKVDYTFEEVNYGFGYVVEGAVTKENVGEKLTAVTAAPTDATATGDVNGIGGISYEDAQAAFGVANKIGSLTVRLMLRADVDHSGNVNAADVAAILLLENYTF